MGAVMQRRRFLVCLVACPQAGCDSTPPDDPNEYLKDVLTRLPNRPHRHYTG